MAADAIKDGARQFAAGGSAGLVEVCLMHPLDLIKTRLQVAQHDRGMMDCVRKTFKNEGFLGFYKGILPPILAETPKRATKFFTFEQYKKMFSHPHVSPAISLSMAGLFCGFTEAVVICPFEVVKVRLQAERGVSLMEQKSTAAMARDIIKTDGMGFNGLYRGFTATLGRHGVWNMFYFGLYHNLKIIIPDAKKTGRNCSLKSKQSISLQAKVGRQTLFHFSLGALYKGPSAESDASWTRRAITLIVYEYVYDWLNDPYANSVNEDGCVKFLIGRNGS
ncbi:2-oxodicarboxylate carrier 2 domain protein [Ostertagia ostertagi]